MLTSLTKTFVHLIKLNWSSLKFYISETGANREFAIIMYKMMQLHIRMKNTLQKRFSKILKCA